MYLCRPSEAARSSLASPRYTVTRSLGKQTRLGRLQAPYLKKWRRTRFGQRVYPADAKLGLEKRFTGASQSYSASHLGSCNSEELMQRCTAAFYEPRNSLVEYLCRAIRQEVIQCLSSRASIILSDMADPIVGLNVDGGTCAVIYNSA